MQAAVSPVEMASSTKGAQHTRQRQAKRKGSRPQHVTSKRVQFFLEVCTRSVCSDTGSETKERHAMRTCVCSKYLYCSVVLCRIHRYNERVSNLQRKAALEMNAIGRKRIQSSTTISAFPALASMRTGTSPLSLLGPVLMPFDS